MNKMLFFVWLFIAIMAFAFAVHAATIPSEHSLVNLILQPAIVAWSIYNMNRFSRSKWDKPYTGA